MGAAANLVVVGSLAHGVTHPLAGPFTLGAGARHQIGLLVGELLVLFALVPAVDRALFEITVVPTAENGAGVLRQIQLQDTGHAAGEELSVVAHQHHSAAQFGDETLQPGQPVQVEVIGRLVEQHDVETRQQQRGQTHPRRLPTRERGHLGRVRRLAIQPQVGEHGG